jgi:hypothetical protein
MPLRVFTSSSVCWRSVAKTLGKVHAERSVIQSNFDLSFSGLPFSALSAAFALVVPSLLAASFIFYLHISLRMIAQV